MNEDITAYIHQARSYGLNEKQIRTNLLAVGWDAQTIDKSFSEINIQNAPVTAPQPAAAAEHAKPELNRPDNPNKKKWLIAGGIIFAVLAAGAGFTAIAFNPTRVFNRFLSEGLGNAYQSKFSFNYIDGGAAQLPSIVGFTLKNLAVEVSGTSQVNATDSSHTKSQGELRYTVGAGGNNFSTTLKYRRIGRDIYVNAKDSALLSLLYLQDNQTQVEWARIDFAGLAQDSKDNETSVLVQKIQQPSFQKKLADIWIKHKILKMDKYLGIEKINGTRTFHLRLSLDKIAAAAAAKDTATALSEADPKNLPPDALSAISNVIDNSLKRVEIKQFEIWLGILDQRPYRIHFTSNAPSLISLIQHSTENLQPQPSNPTQLINPSEQAENSQQAQFQKIFDKAEYAGQIKFDTDYSDFGKTVTVEEPKNFIDLTELIKKQAQSQFDPPQTLPLGN